MGTGKSTEEGIDPSGWERFIYYSKKTSSYNLVVTQWISLRNASQSSLPRTKQLNKHKQPWYFFDIVRKLQKCGDKCRVTPDASVVPGLGLSQETSCRCESWPRGSPAHSAADIGNISDSQIARFAANYGLRTLQCNVSCRQIMILVWSGQLRWCHRLINWSEHDTHSHWHAAQ